MSAQRMQSDFLYKSVTSSSEVYYYTIVADTQMDISVKNITGPNGQVIDSMTAHPEEVITDIASSIAVVKDLLSITSRLSGSVDFTAQTSVTVTLAEAQDSAGYSVLLDTTDFVEFRVTSKTGASFVVESSTTYTGTVLYTVFI